MELRDVLLRTFVRPVWLPGPPKVERWRCPACDREVERISPAWKGIWFTAGPDEVTALCARTHRAHDRRGQPLPADEDLAGVEDWVPIVAVEPGPDHGDGPRPSSFVALLPPAGVAFVLDRTADAYVLRRLEALAPSMLVGAGAGAQRLEGELIGRVAATGLRFDGLRAVRVVAELGLAVGDPAAGDALEGGERPAAV